MNTTEVTQSKIMIKYISFIIFLTVSAFGCDQKFDREIPAYPSEDDLIKWGEQFEFISLVKIVKRDNALFFEQSEILKGQRNKNEFNEYIPNVDPKAVEQDTFIFLLRDGQHGKVVKLLAVKKDEIKIIGGQKILFRGYEKEEILKILQPKN